MIIKSIYLKKNYGGGTQVLNKVSEAISAQQIYLFEPKLLSFFKNILFLKENKSTRCICSDPIAGILLYIFRIDFIRFVQGKDTIYFDHDYSNFFNYIYKKLYRWSFKQDVIYNSEFIKNWITDSFSDIKFIGKISPGTDYTFYNLQKEFDFIYVFRKYSWKNTKFFINHLNFFEKGERIAIINSDNLDLSYILNKSSAQINILNNVTTVELNKYFCKSKYFISTTIDEGFGMPALEAMSSKCLPIVPNVGGTNDFCIDKINSLLFKNNDPCSFKKVLNEARSIDISDYQNMVEEAYSKSRNFTWGNTILNTLNLNEHFE